MDSNRIHPTAVIGNGVELGRGNIVMPYAVILGPTRIGDNNWFGPHAAIGAAPQHRSSEHSDWTQAQGKYGVEIGSRNRFREFTTIHQGLVGPTRIHNDCFLMAYTHVPHDAEYQDGVTIANATQVGGHTWLGERANLGLGVEVHQGIAVGAYAMIGMNSTVTTDIPPFAIAFGSPARVRGVNRVGLDRSGLADTGVIDQLDDHYRSTPTTPDFLCGKLAELVREFTEKSSRRSD